MAAITLSTAPSTAGEFVNLVNATAQANTGQTTWVSTPAWALYATVWFNITANGGTTPGPSSLGIKSADPKTLNDTNALTLKTGTTIATTGMQVWDLGPGVTGIADATSATRETLNCVLPELMGFTVTLDRSNADETYTYTLSVMFR